MLLQPAVTEGCMLFQRVAFKAASSASTTLCLSSMRLKYRPGRRGMKLFASALPGASGCGCAPSKDLNAAAWLEPDALDPG